MLRTGMATALGVSNISVVYLYVGSIERSPAPGGPFLGIPLKRGAHVDCDGYTISLVERTG
jgi:hypothetical protein